ncbi:FtsB family cell division protein [Salisaeta longa]|uniref:FtsB family cell division protein n=1 Tax=Salisaeta longa TaxID=503170 RepID=UPI0003B4C8B9|nr:septum formation initiator family protein [Salisaeta longa]
MEGSIFTSRRVRGRWLVGGALLLVLLWVGFFDSHSLWQRWQWAQAYERVQAENKQLKARIQRLQAELDRPLPDSTVERIAREVYGMRKPNETVYRVVDAPPTP